MTAAVRPAPALGPAGRLPGPPELLPGRPDAVVDLQTDEGAALAGARWRHAGARLEEVGFVELAGPGTPDPLGPGTVPNRTYDVVPHAQAPGFDDSGWEPLAPADTMRRLSTGRVCFHWYRVGVTVPERFGDLDATGATVVFEVVVDDYAEVWVDGAMPLALGLTGGQVVAGFNAPNRVVLTRDARPGDRFQIAVLGMNGPISAAPANYIWLRTATLDVYAAGRGRPAERVGAGVERVAGGFESTAGPAWSPDGALLFSSPATNTLYRLDPEAGQVTVFRSKSGYSGLDIGRHREPGAGGLAFSPEGLLAICQQGNRRVLRVNPHGDTTVLAERFGGRRLNCPRDLVFRSDGTLFFTDPAAGLPGGAGDPDRELPCSGVYRVRDGEVALVTGELREPTGVALSPDERRLYVGEGDPRHPVVMRYDLERGGDGDVFCDLSGAAGEGGVAGLACGRDGTLYVCAPGGIQVVSAAGDPLDRLELPESPRGLAWGGADGRTLYVTAGTSVYRMELP